MKTGKGDNDGTVGLREFSEAIDSRFSDIQRYICGFGSLDENTRENMESLCIECNDMIIRMYENSLLGTCLTSSRYNRT